MLVWLVDGHPSIVNQKLVLYQTVGSRSSLAARLTHFDHIYSTKHVNILKFSTLFNAPNIFILHMMRSLVTSVSFHFPYQTVGITHVCLAYFDHPEQNYFTSKGNKVNVSIQHHFFTLA
jgi:hypothetical protein